MRLREGEGGLGKGEGEQDAVMGIIVSSQTCTRNRSGDIGGSEGGVETSVVIGSVWDISRWLVGDESM